MSHATCDNKINKHDNNHNDSKVIILTNFSTVKMVEQSDINNHINTEWSTNDSHLCTVWKRKATQFVV